MAGRELPDCDKELWRRGEHIATIIDLESSEIERIVKDAAERSGQRIDWHYVGGRAAVRALGDLEAARRYLQENLRPYDGRTFSCYRFTTGQDSHLPLSLITDNPGS